MVTGSHFQGNVAGFSGGAIFNRFHSEFEGGDLTVTDTDFLQNYAFGGSGGGIANESDLTVSDAVFGSNRAEDGGGALYNQSGSSFTVTDSAFSLNEALLGSGGAVYVQGTSDLDGSIWDSSFTFNYAYLDGGAVYIVAGSVGLVHSSLIGNYAYRNGGGVYNLTGDVIFSDGTIENNDADQDGGGLYNSEKMSINYSTFSGNEAEGLGGGVYHNDTVELSIIENSTFYNNAANQGGGIYSRANLKVINCTLSSNSASTGEGGCLNTGSSTSIYNSIVANSTSGGNCKTTNSPANWGNNIDSGTTCGFGTLHDSHSSTNPLLGTLKDNGGRTKTMMLQPGSLAIDGVTYNPPNQCPENDQRRLIRPFGSFNDIGSVEGYYLLYMPIIRR